MCILFGCLVALIYVSNWILWLHDYRLLDVINFSYFSHPYVSCEILCFSLLSQYLPFLLLLVFLSVRKLVHIHKWSIYISTNGKIDRLAQMRASCASSSYLGRIDFDWNDLKFVKIINQLSAVANWNRNVN